MTGSSKEKRSTHEGAELSWNQPYISGAPPSKRSGHTFTILGSNGFLFAGLGGSDGDGPNDDLYQLKMAGNFEWVKLSTEEIQTSAADNARPLARWKHSACTFDKKFIIIFGGFHSSMTRLNDVWVLDSVTLSWSRPGGETASFTPRGNHIVSKCHDLCPSPRGGHTASVVDSMMWVFGGYGGVGYSRRDYNDIHVYDIEAAEWVKAPVIKGTPPKPRSGHSASAVDEKIFIFGGWNSVEQFNDLFILDTVTNTWQTVDNFSLEPRWNHTACSVEAIPNWKIFIFGGCTGNLQQTKRAQGNFSNKVLVLDSGSNLFTSPAISGKAPPARSDTDLGYDTKGSRLVFIGGWSNQWLDDVYTLDVGAVVGPPYAIVGVYPESGPVTGGQELTIKGIDFVDDPSDPRIKVRFASKRCVEDVPARFVDKETVVCRTPDFTAVEFRGGELAVDIRVAFKDDSFTTTSQKYQYYSVCDASKCIAFGAGVLSTGCAGVQTTLVVNANDHCGDRRVTGGDEFSFSVEETEGGMNTLVTDATIEDQEDGTYLLSYTPPQAGTFEVSIMFTGSCKDDSGNTFDTGKAGHINGSPFTVTFEDGVPKTKNKLNGPLVMEYISNTYEEVHKFITSCRVQLEKAVDPGYQSELAFNTKLLVAVKEKLFDIELKSDRIELKIQTLIATAQYLHTAFGMDFEKRLKSFHDLVEEWGTLTKGGHNSMIALAKSAIKPHVAKHGEATKEQLKEYEAEVKKYAEEIRTLPFYFWKTGPEAAIHGIAKAVEAHEVQQASMEEKEKLAQLFECSEYSTKAKEIVQEISVELECLKSMWDFADESLLFFEESKSMLWSEVDPRVLEEEAKIKAKAIKKLDVSVRESDAFQGLENEVTSYLAACPLIAHLHGKTMRPRHWKDLQKAVGKEFALPSQKHDLLLNELVALNLPDFASEVEEIAERAVQEEKMEVLLSKISTTWETTVNFVESEEDNTLKMDDDDLETLESDQLAIQSMMSSRHVGFFQEDYVDSKGSNRRGIKFWRNALANVAEVVALLVDIQRHWSYLEPLFMKSPEVKAALPEDAKKFEKVNTAVLATLKAAKATRNILSACDKPGLLGELTKTSETLELCKKSLSDYLDTKRTSCPRFYFLSEVDLLDILSNGAQPEKILKHIPKIIPAVKSLELQRNETTGWVSKVGKETGRFESPIALKGKVETYLGDLLKAIQMKLRDNLDECYRRSAASSRVDWLLAKEEGRSLDFAQIQLVVSHIHHTREVESSLDAQNKGNKSALRDHLVKQTHQIEDLVGLVLKALTPSDRQRVMCQITMDVHLRDVVQNLIAEDVKDKDALQWGAQLKMRLASWPKAEIWNARFTYDFEYLGNGPRLVVTPLTDRIYLTATQALHLKMGCAPTGPAGTGKTETTKDLAGALGKCCFVFNCTPEMDYKSLGNIFKGIATSGAWGCFDEFNRLALGVLSVCSVQFKAICNGIRENTKSVTIEGSSVTLENTCAVFITMNPFSVGRSKLPEGIKALFRPVAVVTPDHSRICENMLMAEGFLKAKSLATKFCALYDLFSEMLSKQKHYDWGLRAIKSVLCVAGAMRREGTEDNEELLIFRALRDFNLPKLVHADLAMFHSLLKYVFPKAEIERNTSTEMAEAVREACGARDLWPDGGFMQKVLELEELLAVRHSVLIMGDVCAGKTECWRTLQKARALTGQKTIVRGINPKTQDASELYGRIDIDTREWKDGILSKLMRDMASAPSLDPKWIVLDGDLDTNWIESMNSVMDDNKVLTLASNERIPLLDHMKLLFEIRDLEHVTPATVSRCGIIFMSSKSHWRSIIAAWVQQKEWVEQVKEFLSNLIDKYLPPLVACYEAGTFKSVANVQVCSMVQTLLVMLDCVLEQSYENSNLEEKKMETLFAFATVWAFGSSLAERDGVEYRKVFSDWWRNTFKTVKFPSRDTVFDYWVNDDHFDVWKNSPQFGSIQFDSTKMDMNNVTVPTPETSSINFWLEQMLAKEKPLMLVGRAGCGKTNIIKGNLKKLESPLRKKLVISFNYYTSASVLQGTIEGVLEKKTGSNYGAPGSAKLMLFLDDLNLPRKDKFNTQDAIALVRQHMDYGHVYDRQKLTAKNILNCQYVAAMNPNAGAHQINPRLQRHFVALAVGFPAQTSLLTIYQTFLDGHLAQFDDAIKALSGSLINGALALHNEVSIKFKKSAKQFHYEFSLRHLSNVFQGLLTSSPKVFGSDASKFVALWLHESQRVYCDCLVSNEHVFKYKEIASSQAKRRFPNFNMARFFLEENSDPLVFSHFVDSEDDAEAQAKSVGRPYNFCPSLAVLRSHVQASLQDYNETNPVMNLVLFDDALFHVARITRILCNPSGHAMLVGVGGSGKRSLAKLAAHLGEFDPVQFDVRDGYSLAEFKDDLKQLYKRAGLKQEKIAFIFADSQIVNDRFLVYLNDLLSSGQISDLYSSEEMDELVSGIFAEVKATGVNTSNESCFEYFLDRVRNNLRCVLCFSPSGDSFRMKAKHFPALVNCTIIDWFRPWPKEALLSVAQKALADVDMPSIEVRHGIEEFMPFSFESVNDVAQVYLSKEHRVVHATAKSYLELINLYTKTLEEKREENLGTRERMERGVRRLESTAEVVTHLEANLKDMLVKAEEKRIEAEAQAEEVERESEIVARETAAANVERDKCDRIAKEVQAIKDDAQVDLDAAKPMLIKAQEALDTLNKKDLGECKSMSTPPKGVEDIFLSAMILLSGVEHKIQLTKSGKVKNLNWDSARKEMMSNVHEFLVRLRDFKEDVDEFRVPENNWKEVRPYLELEHFDPEVIEKKNKAAGGIASWVCNIVNYHDTIIGIQPKRRALNEAEDKLAQANQKLTRVNAKVNELDTRLSKLKSDLDEANRIKQEAIQEVVKGQTSLDLAHRLVTALASENVRWASHIEALNEESERLPGDVLLAAAFVSYIGPFTKPYRHLLIKEKWIPFLQTAARGKSIPMTQNVEPFKVISSLSRITDWNANQLPSDTVSIENATITESTHRWPLIIDPQLQAINWVVKNYESRAIQRCRMNTENLLQDVIIPALEKGTTVVIENIGETVDTALMPLVRREFLERQGTRMVRLLDVEVVAHEGFKLILHTKLSNPVFPPELQAETTVINFSVTQCGLTEQLLGLVVRKERGDLAKKRVQLIKAQSRFTVEIKELEDNILRSLADADEETITEDVALIEGLEVSKKKALSIEEKAAKSKETQAAILDVAEKYRVVAERGALLFFLMNNLYKLHPFYMYSLNAFVVIFLRGFDMANSTDKPETGMNKLRAAAKRVINTQRFNWNKDILTDDSFDIEEGDATHEVSGDLSARCEALQKCITNVVYKYIRRGLFQKDKLAVVCQLAFSVSKCDPGELRALLVGTVATEVGSMGALGEWLSESSWAMVKGLEKLPGLESIGDDLMADADEWEDWYNLTAPGPLPGEYANVRALQRLLILRALRPDRLVAELQAFVAQELGDWFVEDEVFDPADTFQETSSSSPVLFYLFAGVDPIIWVEELAQKSSTTPRIIAMGQGQETIALEALTSAAEKGTWVVLQNVHLMQGWLSTLERKLESLSADAHVDFRVFLSAEPPCVGRNNALPESLLQSCIKVANEAPAGFNGNLMDALSDCSIDAIDKPKKRKYVEKVCYLHALLVSRLTYGKIGWSLPYSFSFSDLMICRDVILRNDQYSSVGKISFLISEVVYGGCIVDDWDRRYLVTQVSKVLQDELSDDYKETKNSPSLHGLSPAAELSSNHAAGKHIVQSLAKLSNILDESRSTHKAEQSTISYILSKLPSLIPGRDETSVGEDAYEGVLVYEVLALNSLITMVSGSLDELKRGTSGLVNMSDEMEKLLGSIATNKVPDAWLTLSYASQKPLMSWFKDLKKRHAQISKWAESGRPASVWLGGLFNPQGFLLAVKQTYCRERQLSISEAEVVTELVDIAEVTEPAEAGSHYIHGLLIEGARWGLPSEDDTEGTAAIQLAAGKDLSYPMPTLLLKATQIREKPVEDKYECPVYTTSARGKDAFVFSALLPTALKAETCVLAGVALLLQTDE